VSPGGHLLTTLAACAASTALGSPAALTAGLAAGGVLIDLDHAADYVLVERQRDLRPGAFLRYYLGGRARRTVLVLHSYELFAVLGVVAWWLEAMALWGYLLGGLLHLTLDLLFNGRYTPRSIGAFYALSYRAAHRFDAGRLLGPTRAHVPAGFWAAFFLELGRLWGARAATEERTELERV
jgi:hypothetical protein